MTSEEIFEKLRPIIRVYLPEDVSEKDIHLQSDLTRELNINSAYFVDIVLDIEDAFDIEFANEDMENFQKVVDAVTVIQEKISGKA